MLEIPKWDILTDFQTLCGEGLYIWKQDWHMNSTIVAYKMCTTTSQIFSVDRMNSGTEV